MKRTIALYILITSMAIALLATAIAEEDTPVHEDMLEYTYVESISVSLSISGGTANCSGSGASTQSWTQTKLTVQLQRSTDGSSWSTLKTWTATTYGKDDANAGGSYPVASGYIYRTKVTCKIQNSSGVNLETVYAFKNKNY